MSFSLDLSGRFRDSSLAVVFYPTVCFAFPWKTSGCVSALGVSRAAAEKIRPIADMNELIEERTGAKPGSAGIYKLNPKVDDLPEGLGYKIDGITLLIMGKSKAASSGCYCPENVLLRRLLKHLVVERNEVVIVDMDAGIKHFTRGTAESVDVFIVVVEPGQRSIQTARTVFEMAKNLGVQKVFVVANKVRGPEDLRFIEEHISGHIIGSIAFSNAIMEAELTDIIKANSYKQSLNFDILSWIA